MNIKEKKLEVLLKFHKKVIEILNLESAPFDSVQQHFWRYFPVVPSKIKVNKSTTN